MVITSSTPEAFRVIIRWTFCIDNVLGDGECAGLADMQTPPTQKKLVYVLEDVFFHPDTGAAAFAFITINVEESMPSGL